MNSQKYACRILIITVNIKKSVNDYSKHVVLLIVMGHAVNTHTHTCAYKHACMHTHTHTHTHIYIYIYTRDFTFINP